VQAGRRDQRGQLPPAAEADRMGRFAEWYTLTQISMSRGDRASAQSIVTTPPIWEGTADAITRCLSG